MSRERFEFGENWRRFLSVVDEQRIAEAGKSLLAMLRERDLKGRSFADVGSGSGIVSLAAVRAGAAKVHSLDYDPQSVACATELRRRFAPDAANWTIERGDALDRDYVGALGAFDVVYSWGVLHHTGDMWRAIDNVTRMVKPGGTLFIAIYNDQGRTSGFWKRIKQLYNRGAIGRGIVKSFFIPYWALRGAALDLVRFRSPLRRYRDYKGARGMSLVHDWVDWLGGYPFEVARPEEIFRFLRDRGFALQEMSTCGGGLGCNEFVFRRAS